MLPAASSETIRVLVVDDSVSIQHLVGRLLERHGYCCTFAGESEPHGLRPTRLISR